MFQGIIRKAYNLRELLEHLAENSEDYAGSYY